jgi:prepilin-type N-terminal cleavage/methylation domain-containing protein
MSAQTGRNAAAPRVPDGGFTLLELLVGLALAALLMAAIPAAIRLGTRTLNQAEALTNDAADRAALEFVAERLAETMALYERAADGRLRVAFYGDARSIGFVTPATMDPRDEPTGGLFLMELARQETTSRMVLRWQPFRPGLTKAPGATGTRPAG